MPRFYYPAALKTGSLLDLSPDITRHVQVLRLQPGDTLTLFNTGPVWGAAQDRAQVPKGGAGGEYQATITHMGRGLVRVHIDTHQHIEREPTRSVHLAIGIPANERMDWLVEKATELGVASIQPLLTQRSVLRVAGERAEKKMAHWQNIAIAACEQCGGNRVPTVHPITELGSWIKTQSTTSPLLLSLRSPSQTVPEALHALQTHSPNAKHQLLFLSGPEGGLSHTEEDAALACGFTPVSLGPRTLRAETAALAALMAALVTRTTATLNL